MLLVQRTLLLDAGGVLIKPNPTFFVTRMHQLGSAIGDAEAELLIPRLISRAARCADPVRFWSGDEVPRALAEFLGLSDANARALWSAAAERGVPDELWAEADADLIAAVEALRSEGVRIGIVSNNDGTLDHHLERLGISGLFNAVIDSSVAGMSKPDSRIFRLAAQRLGTTIDKCVMVGDDPYFDIVGSQRAGVHSCALWDKHDAMDEALQHLSKTGQLNGEVERIKVGDDLRHFFQKAYVD